MLQCCSYKTEADDLETGENEIERDGNTNTAGDMEAEAGENEFERDSNAVTASDLPAEVGEHVCCMTSNNAAEGISAGPERPQSAQTLV